MSDRLIVIVAGTCTNGNCGCMKYNQETLSPNDPPPFHDGCTCYLQPTTDAAPEQADADGVTEAETSTSLEAYLMLLKKVGRLRADLEAEREMHAKMKGALISYNAALIEEQEGADALAAALRKVEWVGEDVDEEYGPWCEWCGSYKENSGHASDCGRQDVLRAHDARRADGGEGGGM